MTYDPVTGAGYTQAEATRAWNGSMNRASHEGPKWCIRGARPSEFYWSYFNFQPFTGRVTAEADGFHWQTASYDSGEVIYSGVTASVYEAYQSVVQNRPVSRATS